jgi:hypothetical protein
MGERRLCLFGHYSWVGMHVCAYPFPFFACLSFFFPYSMAQQQLPVQFRALVDLTEAQINGLQRPALLPLAAPFYGPGVSLTGVQNPVLKGLLKMQRLTGLLLLQPVIAAAAAPIGAPAAPGPLVLPIALQAPVPLPAAVALPAPPLPLLGVDLRPANVIARCLNRVAGMPRQPATLELDASAADRASVSAMERLRALDLGVLQLLQGTSLKPDVSVGDLVMVSTAPACTTPGIPVAAGTLSDIVSAHFVYLRVEERNVVAGIQAGLTCRYLGPLPAAVDDPQVQAFHLLAGVAVNDLVYFPSAGVPMLMVPLPQLRARVQAVETLANAALAGMPLPGVADTHMSHEYTTEHNP